MSAPEVVEHLIRHWGALGVGAVVALESLGVPAPGESLVIAAALAAASGYGPSIVAVVAAATVGAIVGDNIGYLIGAQLGDRLLVRYGAKVGLDERRLALGRFLFARHGAKVVFVGRFVAVLRTFAALLAGANRMEWRRFLVANAAGGAVWAALYGFGAYALGDAARHVAGPLGLAFAVVAALGAVALALLVRRQAAQLAAEAEAGAAPGRMAPSWATADPGDGTGGKSG